MNNFNLHDFECQVRKLTYLQMLGYNVSWASFAIIEVMSQQRFAHKRIGYQAANQVINKDLFLLGSSEFMVLLSFSV